MTGSGKTLVYILPILEKLSQDPYGIFSVVFSPSRELAQHIYDQFNFYGKQLNIRCSLLIGGSSYTKQMINLDGIPHVIIATPGRFYEICESNQMMQKYLKNMKFLVLDEFDKLLDKSLMFFISKILKYFPKNKQFILTTSTFKESKNSLKVLNEKYQLPLENL